MCVVLVRIFNLHTIFIFTCYTEILELFIKRNRNIRSSVIVDVVEKLVHEGVESKIKLKNMSEKYTLPIRVLAHSI